MYYENQSGQQRMDNARLLFTLFSPAQIRDMVDLAQARGHALASDVHSGSGSKWDLPHLFAYADPSVVPAEDIPALLNGIALILASAMRSPLGNDQYEELLVNTFGMPDAMAAKFAKNIETEDADYGSEDSWAYKIYASVAGFLRKTGNWISDIFQTGWEIDQDQDNDTDFLFELVQLGRVAVDAKTAIQMTRSKAYMDNMSSFVAGAPIEAGDPDSDAQLVDMAKSLRSFVLRPLPLSVMGTWYAPLSASRKKTAEALQSSSKADLMAKLETMKTMIDPNTPEGKANLAMLTLSVPSLSPILSSFAKKSVAKSAAGSSSSSIKDRLKPKGDVDGSIETGGPLADLIKSAFRKMRSKGSASPVVTGDQEIDSALNYAFETGDINPLAERILTDVSSVPDEAVGDVELQDAVSDAVEAYGDVLDDDSAVEAGGLISRWRKTRTARATRRGTKRVVRKKRRAQRKDNREYQRAERDRARQMGRGTDYRTEFDPQDIEDEYSAREDLAGQGYEQRDFDPSEADYYPGMDETEYEY